MANRLSLPNIQLFDSAGNVLSGGKLRFTQVGSDTLKDTYSDSELTTPNTNPVVADAYGRVGDIWLDGSYRVTCFDSNDVQQWQADPVGPDTIDGPFADWSSTSSYSIGDFVRASNGNYYESQSNSNQGNDPTLDAVNWSQVKILPPIATQAEAEAGTNNTAPMTPLRTQEHFDQMLTEAQTVTGQFTMTDPRFKSVPSFLARRSTLLTGTGDGSFIDCVFDSEVFDLGSDYNPSTGVFTAPESGKYFLMANVIWAGNESTTTEAQAQLVTSNQTYRNYTASFTTGTFGFRGTITFAGIYDMDAGDTAKIQLAVFDSPTSTGEGLFGSNYSTFSGLLMVKD